MASLNAHSFGILISFRTKWVHFLAAWGIALVLLGVATVPLSASESQTSALDSDTGAEIQAFHDQYIPVEYAPPSRAWVYADVAVLAAMLAVATWFARTNRPPRWISAQLAVALLYFGFFRGGCICPAGSTANIFLALWRPELVGLATLVLFLLPLVAALFSGRVFCGSVCPIGALQQLLAPSKVRPIPRWLHRPLLVLPIIFLAATAWQVWAQRGFLPCELDPYKPVFFQGHALGQKLASVIHGQYTEPGFILAGNPRSWAILIAALVAGWLVPRFFCRYVCPYGVLLGSLSLVGFWRREIDSTACVHCARCVSHCPAEAIEKNVGGAVKVSPYQCVQCGRCHELCSRKSIQCQKLAETQPAQR